MAGVSTEQGGDSLNTELNLVPFIDLLSSLVLFLLLTAVWVQISAIPASVDSKGTVVADKTEPNILSVQVTPQGYELIPPPSLLEANLPSVIPRVNGSYDRARLESLLVGLVKRSPSPTVAVSGEDSVEYGEIVRAIDLAKASGLPNVALSSN